MDMEKVSLEELQNMCYENKSNDCEPFECHCCGRKASGGVLILICQTCSHRSIGQMQHIQLYWDPDRGMFMDEGGFEWWPYDLTAYIPIWALELSRIYRDRGEEYFAFSHNGTFVEMFWPSEDVNWYL